MFTLYIKALKIKKEIISKLKYAQYLFVLLYFCIKKIYNELLKIIGIMKKFLFFLPFVLFSLCACMVACTESPSVTECEVIDVKQPKFTNWASLLSIAEVVPLENTNSSLLTVASKCRVEGNLILFQDFKLKSMFVFDKHNGQLD